MRVSLFDADLQREGAPFSQFAFYREVTPHQPGELQTDRHSESRHAAAIRAGIKEPVFDVGPLDTTRDFIDARDVATALKCIADNGEKGGAYNVGSGVETPVALVVSRAGHSLVEDDLKQWSSERLSKSQRLARIIIQDEELPKNHLGKVLKVKLREELRETLGVLD